MTRYATILVVGTLALTLAGCRPESHEEPPAEGDEATEPSAPEGPPPAAGASQATATAHLQPADPASGTSGTVTFTQETTGVRVQADVSGLAPGKHGLHIHENGECTPPFESAGAHLNPYGLDHGCPPDEARHLGDLGNVEVGDDGRATFDQVVDKISLVDPAHQIAGKAVILHVDEDDCSTQPSGASGAPVACAVVELTSHAAGGAPPPADHRPPGE